MSNLSRIVSKKELENKRNYESITDVLEIDEDSYSRIMAETFGKLIEAMMKPTKLESAYLLLEYLGFEDYQITVERLIKMLALYLHIQDLYDLVVSRIAKCSGEIRTSMLPILITKIPRLLELD